MLKIISVFPTFPYMPSNCHHTSEIHHCDISPRFEQHAGSRPVVRDINAESAPKRTRSSSYIFILAASSTPSGALRHISGGRTRHFATGVAAEHIIPQTSLVSPHIILRATLDGQIAFVLRLEKLCLWAYADLESALISSAPCPTYGIRCIINLRRRHSMPTTLPHCVNE